MSLKITPIIDPLEAADNQAVMDHVLFNKPIPADVRERVRERAAKITAELRERGITNIAVELIREGREDPRAW